MLATTVERNEDDDVFMAADDDEYYHARTEIPAHLITSYNRMENSNNNVTYAKINESLMPSKDFAKPEISKFPIAIKKNEQFVGEVQVERKQFPQKCASQTAVKQTVQMPECKFFIQLDANLNALKSQCTPSFNSPIERPNKFPIVEELKMRQQKTFPCGVFNATEVCDGLHSLCALEPKTKAYAWQCEKLSATGNLCKFPISDINLIEDWTTNMISAKEDFKFPFESWITEQLKKNATTNDLWEKSTAISTTETVDNSKIDLQHVNTYITSLRPYHAAPFEATTELRGFPLSQLKSLQIKCFTFPFILSLEKNGEYKAVAENTAIELVNNRTCAIKFCENSIQVQDNNSTQTNSPSRSFTEATVKDQMPTIMKKSKPRSKVSKVQHKKIAHAYNKRRYFPCSKGLGDRSNTESLAVAPKFPYTYFVCHNNGTLNNPTEDKTNLCFTQLTVFPDLAQISPTNALSCTYTFFPLVTTEASGNMRAAAGNFPIQNIDTPKQAYQNQITDHVRVIQVQPNQEQHHKHDETVENIENFKQSNYYLEQEQHINDADNLATSIVKAKNTTESQSSQNNVAVANDAHDSHYDDDDDDESDNSVCIGGESTNIFSPSIGTKINIVYRHSKELKENNERNSFDTSTPPTILENFKLLDSYSKHTLESSTNIHQIPKKSSPCSDVRDSSSKEVLPSPLNVNVNSSERLTTETQRRSLLFAAEEIARATSTDFLTLPKYYLNNTEVDKELIENLCNATLSIRRARDDHTAGQTNVQRETEIARRLNEEMTLTEIEDSEVSLNCIEFSSILGESENQQDKVGGIAEDTIDEMKLEMKSSRGSIATSADAADSAARRYTQLKNEQNLINTRTPAGSSYGVRGHEISARATAAPTESIGARKPHSLTDNSAIGHKLQLGNGTTPKDKTTLGGTERTYTTASSRRNSFAGSTPRTNESHASSTYSSRGSAISGTTQVAGTTNSRRNSYTSSIPRTNDTNANTTHTADRNSLRASATTPVGSTSVSSSLSSRSSLTSSASKPIDTQIGPVKYRRAPTKFVPSTETDDVTRSVSLDGADTVLPARTLLRRQRRMRSQGSHDEAPESTIERLNRLRARISGALSEVKGVLKHYSTDVEEASGEPETPKIVQKPIEMTYTAPKEQVPIKTEELTSTLPEPQEPAKKEGGPITLRFVKIVRRRSIFDEEDEDREKEKEQEKQIQAEVDSKTKVSNDAMEHESEQAKAHHIKSPLETISQAEVEGALVASSNGVVSSEAAFSEKIQDYSNEKLDENVQEIPAIIEEQIESEEAGKEQLPEITSDKVTKPRRKTSEGHTVKRIIRRASIAAVESSKIVPPIQSQIPLDIKSQRRPSDSEAIIKKKFIKVKTNTTATDGETTPKAKLINKVKRPSLKHANKDVQVISETITDALTDIAKSTQPPIKQNSSTSGQMQANNSNKDAVKTETAAPTATTLATQLVIDDASLAIGQATAVNANSRATKDTCVATNSIAPSGTTLASPLPASEQSGHIVKPATEILNNAEIVTEAPITVVGTNKPLETTTTAKQQIHSKLAASDVSHRQIKEYPQDHNREPIADNAKEANRIATLTDDKCKTANVASSVSDSKKLINQKAILPGAEALHEEQVKTTPAENQQVSAEISKAPVAAVASDVIPASVAATTSDALISPTVEATKAKATPTAAHSSTATGTSEASTEKLTATAEATMPELQVKAAQVFIEPKEFAETKEPFNTNHENAAPKKKVVILKKLVRKGSTEKSQQTQTNNKINAYKSLASLKDKSKKDNAKEEHKIPAAVSVDKIEDIAETTNEVAIPPDDEHTAEDQIEEVIEEPPAPEKKKRKIKKRVIIKREHRRLSVSESSFFKSPEIQPSSPVEDILEKPVEYLKVPSDEEQDYEEIPTTAKPTKSCLKVREFQEGDQVMYAERFKKTQVRWKRGIVLERITSISYKLEIEGKEVPAHISYIKKYTGRKVNFGGKEYLEIDYEQIAEEEEKARTYSIWNMV